MKIINMIAAFVPISLLLMPTVADTHSVQASDSDTAFLKGDVNSDGVFNNADVATLQKWLLDGSFYGDDIKLNNWKAADLCNDGILDVFDLCLMKQELLNSGESVEIPSLDEIIEISDDEVFEIFSDYTFQDIECIWGKMGYYYSGLYGGAWEIGDKEISLVFDFYTQKLESAGIFPIPTEDDYIRSLIKNRINSSEQTVERLTETLYSTERYDLKNRVTSITVFDVNGEVMTSGEVRVGVAKTVVVCYDEDKRLEFEVIY